MVQGTKKPFFILLGTILCQNIQPKHVEDQPIAHNEEEHDLANPQNLHNCVNKNKNLHLSFISEIFDTFEASMRATPTSSEFVYCLINLHQSNKSGHTNKLDQRSHASCQSGPTIEQLLQHIQTLQNSFMKFAYSCKAFKRLLHTDRKELLRRNGLMFVMVCIESQPCVYWKSLFLLLLHLVIHKVQWFLNEY